MTYPEFLEGIARVAMLKWEDGSWTIFDKVARAITAVTSLLSADAVPVLSAADPSDVKK